MIKKIKASRKRIVKFKKTFIVNKTLKKIKTDLLVYYVYSVVMQCYLVNISLKLFLRNVNNC